jgi:chorismate mutase/prephenate dehydratase
LTDRQLGLAELRAQVDAIDLAILEQLNARARLSRAIHALIEAQPPSADVAERAWLERLASLSSGDLPTESLWAVFRAIRAGARAIEQPVRIAYLGPEGSFGHQMAKQYFGAGSTFVECGIIGEALDEVVRGRAVFAVFPFESSVDGLVQTSVTALAQTELVIVAERSIAATYDIMTKAADLARIEKVYATAAAHAASERFLQRELPNAAVVDVRSPVVACQLAAAEETAAAVGPPDCGRDVGLEIARSNIGDVSDLRFRYAIAGTRPSMRSGDDTTSLLFSVNDSPGALFDVLRHFAERGVNLKKLQSRPLRSESWDYVFYVEVSGHVTDRPVVTALEAVKRTTKYLKLLGSFPAEQQE